MLENIIQRQELYKMICHQMSQPCIGTIPDFLSTLTAIWNIAITCKRHTLTQRKIKE